MCIAARRGDVVAKVRELMAQKCLALRFPFAHNDLPARKSELNNAVTNGPRYRPKPP